MIPRRFGEMVVIVSVMLYCCAAGADAGREANIAVRSQPPAMAEMLSGPYPAGEALPERTLDEGVEIAGVVFRHEDYAQLKASGYIPMRRELTDAELFAELNAEHGIDSAAELVARAREKFSGYVPSLYWDFRNPHHGNVVNAAESTYAEHFTEDGVFKPRDLSMNRCPGVAMLRWAGSYWNTRDPKWARATRDAFIPHYHANRPPLNKVRDAKARGAWHVLGCGAQVPFLIEMYALVHDSEQWGEQDHLSFAKAMLERGRFLRYTTVPVGPWPKFNPFGYGNWVLYQLQGLLAIAAYFPEFREAGEWLEHASYGIGRHGDWGVMPDGGFDEYAYGYLGQVAGQMAYCYNVYRSNGLPLPPRFSDNVLRLNELFLKMAVPGCEPLPFGDVARTSRPLATRCRWAALAFLDARFKHFAGEIPSDTIDAGARVLHPDDPEGAAQRFREIVPVQPERTSHAVAECGWTVLRSGWDEEATVIAVAFSGSDRVFHSGWEMLGFNLWSKQQPLLRKLLGTQGYMRGYPEGVGRTPRQANHVVLRNENLRRVAGSLRNWFASQILDYLHMDHRGWRDGLVTARRRVLFLKPDWVLLLDDIEGDGQADLVWQAHTDDIAPLVSGAQARIAREAATATLYAHGAKFGVEALPIEASDATVYMLTQEKAGELPARFVTLIHVGEEQITARAVSRPGASGLQFGVPGQEPWTVFWESEPTEHGRFMVSKRAAAFPVFFAGDGNPNAALTHLLEQNKAVRHWNGRALLLEPDTTHTPEFEYVLDPGDVEALSYHGRIELTPVGTAARVHWQTAESARHAVLYRVSGQSRWHRQFQPGLHRVAWVLLPDLVPSALYELQIISELESGRVLRSVPFTRRAPDDWSPY